VPAEPAVVVPVPPLATDRLPVKPKVKVLLAIEPVTLVSLTVNPTKVVPKVEELVPPLAIGKIPVTSEVRLIFPVFNSPPTVLTIPVPREERVVEPAGLMVKREVPVWEAIWKGLIEP
jgi:hypothetical protein